MTRASTAPRGRDVESEAATLAGLAHDDADIVGVAHDGADFTRVTSEGRDGTGCRERLRGARIRHARCRCR
jgi:hypothetical protein